MGQNVTFNGIVYVVPTVGDGSWGQSLTDYLVAIPQGALQKSGGVFTLSGDVNFGASYGLLSKYFSTRTALPATTGIFRLSLADTIAWRNNANSANLELGVNGSDQLTFNGSAVYPGGITALTGDVTATGPGSVAATIANNAVSDAKLRQSAGLSIIGRASNSTGNVADIVAATDKFVLFRNGTSLVFALLTNDNIDAAAAIAYSKLSLTGSILNTDISASAAIALSKLAALTANRALATNASGVIVVSSVTDTELGYLSGVTSSVVGINDTQTLANKTLTSPIIGTISNTGTLTLPTATDTLVGRATTDTLTNKTIAAGSNTISGLTNTNLSGSAGVTNANLASMNNNTVKGNVSGSAAVPSDLSGTQVTAILDDFVGDSGSGGTKGLVPAPGTGDAAAGKVLKADGTWGAAGTASPLTTKGDLYGYSTTNDRIAAGTNGQMLMSDSNQSLGLRWIDQQVKNYILNRDSEVDTTGWATYADTAANIPSDGTGGTATGLTFSRSTSSPLRGSASFSMVQANSTSLQGMGVSTDFTIDSADQAKALNITFDYNASSTFVASNGTTAPLNDGTTSTNAGNSDVEVFIYDVTNAVLVPVSPQVITANGSNNYQFKGTFQTNPDSTSYRLIFHVATTSANATGWTFKFDNVYVGPQVILQGAPVTDWQTYTPTIGNVSTSAVGGRWRRVGDSIEVDFNLTANGAGSAAVWTVSLPSGLSIDGDKLSTGLARNYIGIMDFLNSGVSNASYILSPNNSTTITYIEPSGGASLASYIWTSGDSGRGRFIVPIAGWSSTVQMSNDTDTRVVAAVYSLSANATVNGVQINFDSKHLDTHSAVTTGASAWKFTAPVSGLYNVSLLMATTAGVLTNFILYKNGVAGYIFADSSSNLHRSGGQIIQLNAGDYIDIRTDASVTIQGDSSAKSTLISIQRLSGPSAIAASESVNCRYINTAGTSIGTSFTDIPFGTKDYDSTGSFVSPTYTIPSPGTYDISASVLTSAVNMAVGNAFLLTALITTGGSSTTHYLGFMRSQVASAIRYSVNGLITKKLNAGDTIKIQALFDSVGGNLDTTAQVNYLQIKRVGN